MLFLILVTLPVRRRARPGPRRMTLPPLDAAARRAISSARFAGLPVLVVGDVMLDRFIVGRVTRISPEAPVPVVQFQVRARAARRRRQRRAQHRRARRARRRSSASSARTRPPRGCASSSPRAGIGADGLVEDPGRPTTEKVRVVTERNQQVARIDYERDARRGRRRRARRRRAGRAAAGRREGAARVGLPEGRDHAARSIERAAWPSARRRQAARPFRSSSTRRSRTSPTTRARRSSRRTITRPRPPRTCASATDDEARDAARDFRARARCDAVLITRGEHGMWLSERRRRRRRFRPSRAKCRT